MVEFRFKSRFIYFQKSLHRVSVLIFQFHRTSSLSFWGFLYEFCWLLRNKSVYPLGNIWACSFSNFGNASTKGQIQTSREIYWRLELNKLSHIGKEIIPAPEEHTNISWPSCLLADLCSQRNSKWYMSMDPWRNRKLQLDGTIYFIKGVMLLNINMVKIVQNQYSCIIINLLPELLKITEFLIF